jgi:hypothetical protein
MAAAQVVVDSAMRFGYSEILARCCAWGLCVGPPSRFLIEGVSQFTRDPADRFPRGNRRAQDTDCRIFRFTCALAQIRISQNPSVGQLPQSSPEQDCLAVGGMKPVRFAWAKSILYGILIVFWRRHVFCRRIF